MCVHVFVCVWERESKVLYNCLLHVTDMQKSHLPFFYISVLSPLLCWDVAGWARWNVKHSLSARHWPASIVDLVFRLSADAEYSAGVMSLGCSGCSCCFYNYSWWLWFKKTNNYRANLQVRTSGKIWNGNIYGCSLSNAVVDRKKARKFTRKSVPSRFSPRGVTFPGPFKQLKIRNLSLIINQYVCLSHLTFRT